MRRPVLIWSMLFALGLAACGSASAPQPIARVSTTPVNEVAAVEPGPRAWVPRAGVDRTLSRGLGHFLANVEVEANLDERRRFVGWRIVALHDEPDDLWKGIDLRVGDVVTSVNGFPIERPQQADRAFKSLRVSSEIRVSLLREGRAIELRFAIVEEGESPPPSTSATVSTRPSTTASATASGTPATSASTPPDVGKKPSKGFTK
jgi:hypothetical protein